MTSATHWKRRGRDAPGTCTERHGPSRAAAAGAYRRRALAGFLASVLVLGQVPCARGEAQGAARRGSREVVVAVLPFRNATGSASFDALARGMPDLLAAMAGHARDVVVVERERLAALFGELGLEGRQDTGGEGALRLGRMLGAGVVVGGSLARVDATPRLVANAHVYDVKSSRVLQSVEVRGSLADLTALAAELAARLFEALDTPFAAPSPEQIDHSPEANLHFMRGLGYYYAGIPERAVAAFTRALATDAGHAAARYWNARAYLLLGDAGHAAIECRRLARDAPGDPRLSELRTLLKTSGGDTP